MLRGGDEFGGGGRGGRAQICDKVRDREVGFVADCRHNRQFRRGDRAGKIFVVEASQVFDRAAAACKQNQVGSVSMFVEKADAGGDRPRTLRTLHDGRVDQEIQPRVSAAHYLDDVVQHRAGGRRDNTDAVRETRQWSLSCRVEETFRLQFVAELLERKLQSTRASWLDRFRDELELPARLIDRDAAADEDGETVLREEAEELRLTAKEHDRKLSVAVLEREVDVAGGRGAAVGDFAGDPEVGVGGLHVLANVGDKVADAPNTPFWHNGRRRRGHSSEWLRAYGRRREQKTELAFVRTLCTGGLIGNGGRPGAAGSCAFEGEIG